MLQKQKIGDLVHDPERRMLSRGGEEIRLPKLSYDLFLCLVRHAPGIVSTDQLLTEVWGDVVVGEETVKQRISLLRQALGDSRDDPVYVESIRGIGYRLVSPVSESEAERPRPQRSGSAYGAFVLLGLILVMWAYQSQRNDAISSDPKYRQIAVLPFQDMSANGDQGYFSDGVHEEVITQLSRISALSVTSRTSVLPYRDDSKNIREIAKELDVGLIVEGSVRHSQDRVRITVQLIDAISDEHLWAENYDRPLSMNELFEIQSDVAERIAMSVETELSAEEISRLQFVPTDSLQAYDMFLLGRYHLYRGNSSDLRQAIEFFNAAILEDEKFAEAYVGLGHTLTFVGTSYGWMEPREAFSRASENASRALELQPDFADALSLRADILAWHEWDWEAAEETYLRAWETGGSGRLGHMLLLSVLGRQDEAIALTNEMLERWPRDHWIRSNAAWRYLGAGDPARAIQEASIAIEIDARIGDPFASRGWSQLALGETELAIADFSRNVELQGRSAASLAALAVAEHRSGRIERAEELLAEIVADQETRFVPPEEIARVLVEFGRLDEAFLHLEAAYEARSRGLIFLLVNRSWDAIRNDPRYHDLLTRMNLPRP